MTDFIIGECLQSIIWPILKQIAANRKIKNKASDQPIKQKSAQYAKDKRK